MLSVKFPSVSVVVVPLLVVSAKEILVVLRELNRKYSDNKYFKYIDEFLNDSNVELENSDIQEV